MLLLWRQKPVRASHAPVAFLSSTVLHLKFEGWRYLLKLNIELQKLMVIVSSESVAPEQSIENRSKNMFQFLKRELKSWREIFQNNEASFGEKAFRGWGYFINYGYSYIFKGLMC